LYRSTIKRECKASARSFNQYQQQLYSGLASLTDLLEAESELVVAQNNYTTALLDYKLAEIQVIKAKGELKH
jgi:outer membrane protein TolC